MAKFYTELNDTLREFIGAQQMFFNASAPNQGRINVSPKGLDTFRILSDKRVAYLDLTGSECETAAHLAENGRLTLMFCSYQDKPLILRLYGKGSVIRPRDSQWQELCAQFPPLPGERQIIVLDIESIMTTCGFAVPCTSTKPSASCCRSSRVKWATSGWTSIATNATKQASTDCRPTCSTTRRIKRGLAALPPMTSREATLVRIVRLEMHYLLFYEKAPDHAEREGPLQAAHRAHVFAAVARGELVLGGPLADPLDGAQALLFRAESAATAEAFAAADPYVVNGIVSRWRVRTWQTVVGEGAAKPLRE